MTGPAQERIADLLQQLENVKAPTAPSPHKAYDERKGPRHLREQARGVTELRREFDVTDLSGRRYSINGGQMHEALTFEELKRAADGLSAYDTGCVDSGIHDPELKQRFVETLKYAISDDERRPTVARMVRDMWLSDEAIEQGYGAEDARRFIDWLDDLGALL